MKIVLLILFISLRSGVCFANANTNQTTILELGKLIRLQTQVVSTYEGYKFTAHWLGDKPMISITQQQTNLKTKKTNVKSIIQVDAKHSKEQEKKTENELLTLATFKPTKMVKSDGGSYEGGNLLRFDCLDEKGVIRVSEWRDPQNGFNVETVFFDEAGGVVGLTYYYKLKINRDFSDIYSGESYRTTLEDADRKVGSFESDDPRGVVDFSIRLLDRVLSKRKIGK